MKLLLVEPEATGHHIVLYARVIVREAIQRDWSVSILTTPKAVRHPAFQLFLAEFGSLLEVKLMPDVLARTGIGSAALLAEQNRCYRSMSHGFNLIQKQERPDRVYIINLDQIDKVLALRGSPFGSVPFSGMMMNVKYHRRQMGMGPPSRSDFLYGLLFRRVLRISELTCATVINESFLAYAMSTHRPEYSKLKFVPDVGQLCGRETRTESRGLLEIPPDGFVVLLYGSLSGRKGIEQLLNAVALCSLPKVIVLLAGSADKSTEMLLNDRPALQLKENGQLISRLGFHDDEQEYRVFRAADVVWLGYVGGSYGSSGVLYQAGSLGLPVLSTRYGLIGWLTRKYSIGITVDPDDAAAVAQGITKLASDRALRDQLGSNGRMLARDHTAEKFGSAVCDAVSN